MTHYTKARYANITLLALTFCLVGLYSYIHVVKGQDVTLRVLISCLPIVAFLPSFIMRSYKAASVFCFVLLLYFLIASQNIFIAATVSTVLNFGLIIALFINAMMYSHWQQHSDKNID